jgi:hypothetical protein
LLGIASIGAAQNLQVFSTTVTTQKGDSNISALVIKERTTAGAISKKPAIGFVTLIVTYAKKLVYK